MTTEYKHDEYCNMLLTLVSVIVVLVLMDGNSHYITPVDIMQTLMCFKHCSSVSMEPENVTSTAHVNADRPRTVWTQTNEAAIFAAVGRKYGEAGEREQEFYHAP